MSIVIVRQMLKGNLFGWCALKYEILDIPGTKNKLRIEIFMETSGEISSERVGTVAG